MQTQYLFPHGFKRAGGIIMSLSAAFLICGAVLEHGFDSLEFLNCKVLAIFPNDWGQHTLWWEITVNNVGNEIAMIGVILSAVFIGFSKEKEEDEYVAKIRLESLMWATYINYGLLLLAILFVYDLRFLDVLIGNMFTLLLVFLIRFHFVRYRQRRWQHEK